MTLFRAMSAVDRIPQRSVLMVGPVPRARILTPRPPWTSVSQTFGRKEHKPSVLNRRDELGQRSETVRRANLSVILRELHTRGALSRSELVARTGLTRSAIRGLIGELAASGLVSETRAAPLGTPGRPSPLVSPDPRRSDGPGPRHRGRLDRGGDRRPRWRDHRRDPGRPAAPALLGRPGRRRPRRAGRHPPARRSVTRTRGSGSASRSSASSAGPTGSCRWPRTSAGSMSASGTSSSARSATTSRSTSRTRPTWVPSRKHAAEPPSGPTTSCTCRARSASAGASSSTASRSSAPPGMAARSATCRSTRRRPARAAAGRSAAGRRRRARRASCGARAGSPTGGRDAIDELLAEARGGLPRRPGRPRGDRAMDRDRAGRPRQPARSAARRVRRAVRPDPPVRRLGSSRRSSIVGLSSAPRRLVRIVPSKLGVEASLRGAAELAMEPLLADPARWMRPRGTLTRDTAIAGHRRVVA